MESGVGRGFRGRPRAAFQPAIRPRRAARSCEKTRASARTTRPRSLPSSGSRGAKDAVPAKEVAPCEPGLVALPLGPKGGARRSDVHRDGIAGSRRRPAGRPQLQSEIEVLGVRDHALVETADRLPRLPAIGAGGSRGPDEDGLTSLCVLRRCAPEPREAGEGGVHREAVALDRLLAGMQEERRHGPEPSSRSNGATKRSRKSGRQSTSLFRSTTISALPARTPRLQAAENPRFSPKLDDANLGKLLAEARGSSVRRPVVADGHGMWHRLAAEMREAALGELPVVPDGNHHVRQAWHVENVLSAGERTGVGPCQQRAVALWRSAEGSAHGRSEAGRTCARISLDTSCSRLVISHAEVTLRVGNLLER